MPILCNRSNDCGSGLFDFMQIRAPDDNKNFFPKNIKPTVFQFPQVAWPSGLRRWFKAPAISMAWLRIPPLHNLFLPEQRLRSSARRNQQLCLLADTRPLREHHQFLWCETYHSQVTFVSEKYIFKFQS